MKARLRPILVIGLALSGCGFNQTPEVRNRFASYTSRPMAIVVENSADPDAAYRFVASISTSPATVSDKGIAITELSDRAQAAYVMAFAAISKDSAALVDAIARPDKPTATSPGSYLAKGRVETRIIASIQPANGLLPPGDRLYWAKLKIAPIGPARFTGWTLAANKKTSITVGTIKANRSDKLTAETGLKLGNPFVDAKIGAESSSSREETANINDQTTIDARIDEHLAELIQTAGWRDDLSGNATFDTTLELQTPFETYIHKLGVLWEKDKPIAGVNVGLARQVIDIPEEQPTCANVELEYVVRHIVSKNETYTEADDVVEFLRGKFKSKPQLLAPIQRTPRWGIDVAGFGPLIVVRGTREEALTLTSVNEAIDFIDWLVASNGAPTLKDAALRVRQPSGKSPDRPLRRSDFDSLVPFIQSGGPSLRGKSDATCSPAP